LWQGKFVGQKQKWFLIDYFGEDKDINIKTKKPEFQKWNWTSKESMLKLIVPFKRKLYKEIVDEFKDFL
jgi:putative (di)nucleoside polyphosphate hydrolase